MKNISKGRKKEKGKLVGNELLTKKIIEKERYEQNFYKIFVHKEGKAKKWE